MSEAIEVVKHSGERTRFSEEKLRTSLKNSGAPQKVIDRVTEIIIENLVDGISTRNIYQHAHKLLKKEAAEHASRYKLKQAILELGPSGYPFEHFTGELFRVQGYEVETGVIVEGQCVHHEVDVIADNGSERLMIECKFHNRHGYKSDVKIPLYIQSRFLDVSSKWRSQPEHINKRMTGWVVTNSRFTTDAIDYGKCIGLKLLGWDYPQHMSLKRLVEIHQIQPITTLSSLQKSERETLFSEGIVLCRNMCDQAAKVEVLIGKKASKLLKEADYICSYTD
jgi:hypothetical protein